LGNFFANDINLRSTEEISKLISDLKEFTCLYDGFQPSKKYAKKGRKLFKNLLKLATFCCGMGFLLNFYENLIAGNNVSILKGELSDGMNYSVPFEVLYFQHCLACCSGNLIVVVFDMMIYEFGSIFLDSLDKLHWDIRQAIKNRDLDSLKRVVDNHNKLSECFLEF
jgi:hypothetical protein